MKVTKVSQEQSDTLAQVASGKRLQDISKEQFVSFQTVRYRLDGLRASMNAKTLPELVAKGVTSGIIKPDGKGGFTSSAIPTQPDRRGQK